MAIDITLRAVVHDTDARTVSRDGLDNFTQEQRIQLLTRHRAWSIYYTSGESSLLETLGVLPDARD